MKLYPLILVLLATPAWAHDYHAEAVKLKPLASRRAQVEVIAKTLKEIDRNVAIHFPSGPYNRYDLIAMCLVESSFWHLERGGVGEQGLFQLRPEWFQKGQNGYFVALNTEMGCRVLKLKWSRWKRKPDAFKRGIICYNGACRNGIWWNDEYYRLVMAKKAKVKHLLVYSKPSTINQLSKPIKLIIASKRIAKRREIRTCRNPGKPKITLNAELARQLEQDVYGRKS